MRIKGLVLQTRRAFVEEHFGVAAWEQVLAALPEQDRQLLRGTIYPITWYPFDVGERLDQAIVDALADGDESVFERIGAKSAQRNLTREHSSFLSPGDPQTFMQRASIIYRFYYDTGYREYIQTGPDSGVMITHDAETFSRPDCLTVIGWYKEALRMCGARDVAVVEEECRARGGSCCRYRFQWRM